MVDVLSYDSLYDKYRYKNLEKIILNCNEWKRLKFNQIYFRIELGRNQSNDFLIFKKK